MATNWNDFTPVDRSVKPLSNSTANVDWSQFEPVDKKDRASSASLLDYGKGVGAGVGQLISGIGYLGEKVGARAMGKDLRFAGDQMSKVALDSMTPEGRRAAHSQVFEDDPDSVFPKLADRWGQAALMGAAQSAPSMVAAAIPGGIAAGLLSKGAGALAARGMGGALAPIAAGSASPVGTWASNTAGQIAARAPSAIGMGAGEGVASGAMNAAQTKSQIEAMPEGELARHPGYSARAALVGPLQALAEMADAAASDVLARTTFSTGVIGALTGGGALGLGYRNMSGVARDGLIKSTLKGGGQEAVQETLQSGPEQLIQNVAIRDYANPDQNVMEGVVSGALSGGAVGGLMGAVTGAGGHLLSPKDPPAPPVVAAPSPRATLPADGPLSNAVNLGIETGATSLPGTVAVQAQPSPLPQPTELALAQSSADTDAEVRARSIRQLQDEEEEIDPLSEGAVARRAALHSAVTRDAETSMAAGDMPVYRSASGMLLALHPSTRSPGMIQVTRYNDSGVLGDSQYASVGQAIEGDSLHYSQRLAPGDAATALTAVANAEQAYQARRQAAEAAYQVKTTAETGDDAAATVVRSLQNRNRSSAASAAQMGRIASDPDPDLLMAAPTMSDGAPVVTGLGNAGAIPVVQVGKAATVSTAKRKIAVRYAVVDAASLSASNHADGSRNIDYASDPAKLVAINNGRTAGIVEAYRRGTAGAYRAAIENAQGVHGIAQDVIRGIKSPVLVRLIDIGDVTDHIGDESNAGMTLGLSATEQARNDAGRLDLSVIEYDEDGRPTPQSMRQFIAAMPDAEQQSLAPNGEPTRQAIDRVSAAVFHAAYDNAELVGLMAEATDPDAINVLRAMSRAAASMGKLKDAGDLDIRQIVAGAAVKVVNAARSGVSMKRFLAQADLLDGSFEQRVAEMFARNSRSVRAIAQRLVQAAETAYAESQRDGVDMFGETVPVASRDDIIEGLSNDSASEGNLGEQGGRRPGNGDDGADADHRRAPGDAGGAQVAAAEQSGRDYRPGGSGNAAGSRYGQGVGEGQGRIAESRAAGPVGEKGETYNEAHGLPDQRPIYRTLDGPELAALRRAARDLERTGQGIFLRVEADGRVIATGPKGARIPEAYRRFANEHGLAFYAQRRVALAPDPGKGEGGSAANTPGRISSKSEPMPLPYRESGAHYFGEDVGQALDRTQKTRFSLAGSPGVRLHRSMIGPFREIQGVVDGFKARFKGAAALTIRVVATVDDIPAQLRPSPFAEGSFHDDAGLIYLIAENLLTRGGKANTQRAYQTLLHEAVGHYGLARMMGERFEAIQEAVMRVARDPGVTADIYALGETGYASVESVRLRYPEASDSEVAQEVIARLAETDPGSRTLHYIRAVVRQWLREMARAMGIKLAITSEEINDLIAKASAYLRSGRNLERSVALGTAQNSFESRRRVIGDSGRDYDQGQRSFFRNVGRDIDEQSRIEKTLDYLKRDFWKKMAVGLVDQFRGLRDLDDGGQAYLLARLSKGTAGAFDALLHHGKLSIRGGVYDGDRSGGFIERLGIPLHGELDDVLWWIAANRAESLTAEGRENLFSAQDIAAGKSLAAGTTAFDYTIQSGPGKGRVTRERPAIYQDALRVFNGFHRNALDLAEQSGLIDGATRPYWESEFYVPFYRVSEDDGEFIGARMGNALVRQRAFEKLKGGSDKLNSDLLSNTLLNWSHLIEAAARNRAAKAALQAAEKMGAAHRAAAGEKNAVWYMDGGKKIEYTVDDPFVLTAITSLEYAGMRNGVMDAMTAFKHYLTIGVTASPAFKVRNLIRDSIQSIGTSELGFNPVRNVVEGYRQTKRDTQGYVSALASGGLIRFGTMLEGSESSRIRQLIKAGVNDSTILNSQGKWRAFHERHIAPAIAAYNELGNRSEEINRAALYNQLVRQGRSHAEAALMARDLMDFSMQGSFNTIRFLGRVVPFFNARLQGMYKLGRAARSNPRKMAVVTGAVALASLALMFGYRDDDDWKRREDWDRDNFWWFKLGGIEFRIPKPFELGAIASLAERSMEYLMSDEMTGERLRRVLGSLAMNNLSMNPVPQMIKPIVDLYANKDSFTGRPIESMGMQNLDPTMRFNSGTSMLARGLSAATLGALSPVQYDHLARAYFGWLGSFVVGGADLAARTALDEPTRPTMDYFRFATQGILREAGSGNSRYVTMLYDQAAELEQAYVTYRRLLKDRKGEEARAYTRDNADRLRRYRLVEAVRKAEARLNQSIHAIEISDLSGDEKKARIEQVQRMKERIAMRIAPGRR